jgi:hypothetical protein
VLYIKASVIFFEDALLISLLEYCSMIAFGQVNQLAHRILTFDVSL